MNEDEYRAEMAKQARLANLIALRALAKDSSMVADAVSVHGLTKEILELAFVR